ncbi:hypothetical protein [Sulfobacillus sp. hq2]|uniref:hypothetical protein n=1 Tax=Sulfobacillus TaxID=28033 RepID=UPI000CD1CD50|nr:hypothetical protein [Sulfobacillus sp. hq2]POB10121.1 hypothetical protein CO251_11595 [Sulfobacillus sp. hq2]
MTESLSVAQQAQALMRHPEPTPWDQAVAESVIGQTAQAIASRLVWPRHWMEQLTRMADPYDEQPPHPLIRALDQAQTAIEAGVAAQDLQGVVLGCRAWWLAAKQVMQAAPSGYFLVEPDEAAPIYVLPDGDAPLARWDDLLHLLAAPDLPRPVRLRWFKADGTCRRDAWAPR